jgi:hypothetical protein
MFEAEDGGDSAAQRVGRATGPELKRVAVWREKRRDVFQKLAA